MTDALLIAHIAVFGAWFGTDLATFYLSRQVLDATVVVPTRAHLAKVMLGVEVIARLCLPTTLVLGLTLSIDLGYVSWQQWWIFPIWLTGVLWVAMVWAIHRDGGTGGPATSLTLGGEKVPLTPLPASPDWICGSAPWSVWPCSPRAWQRSSRTCRSPVCGWA